MHRFFVPASSINSGSIQITGDDALHISKVLRLRAGENVIVCDGEENEYTCEIISCDKKHADLSILGKKRSQAESPVKICLFQGIPKAAKMDLIVQKCTEIGVDRIVPMNTERVVPELSEDKDISNKLQRWRKIAEEASKQSGRGRIPVIEKPVRYKDALEMAGKYEFCIIPYEKEQNVGLKKVLKGKDNMRNAAIVIGPEGGFTECEIAAAKMGGIMPVTLGPRILRTETAGFICAAIINYTLGDLGGKAWIE